MTGIFVVVGLIVFAVILANVLGKTEKNDKLKQRELKIKNIDQILLSIRDMDPDIEIYTLLQYYDDFKNEPKVLKKIESRIDRFVSAYPKAALKVLIEDKYALKEERIFLKEMVLNAGFSVVFDLSELFYENIESEEIRDYIHNLVQNFDSIGLKKFFKSLYEIDQNNNNQYIEIIKKYEKLT